MWSQHDLIVFLRTRMLSQGVIYFLSLINCYLLVLCWTFDFADKYSQFTQRHFPRHRPPIFCPHASLDAPVGHSSGACGFVQATLICSCCAAWPVPANVANRPRTECGALHSRFVLTRPHKIQVKFSPQIPSLTYLSRTGDSFDNALKSLHVLARVLPESALSYDPVSPHHADIILSLAAAGITLRFDAFSHRLRAIVIDKFSGPVAVQAGGSILIPPIPSSASTAPSPTALDLASTASASTAAAAAVSSPDAAAAAELTRAYAGHFAPVPATLSGLWDVWGSGSHGPLPPALALPPLPASSSSTADAAAGRAVLPPEQAHLPSASVLAAAAAEAATASTRPSSSSASASAAQGGSPFLSPAIPSSAGAVWVPSGATGLYFAPAPPAASPGAPPPPPAPVTVAAAAVALRAGAGAGAEGAAVPFPAQCVVLFAAPGVAAVTRGRALAVAEQLPPGLVKTAPQHTRPNKAHAQAQGQGRGQEPEGDRDGAGAAADPETGGSAPAADGDADADTTGDTTGAVAVSVWGSVPSTAPIDSIIVYHTLPALLPATSTASATATSTASASATAASPAVLTLLAAAPSTPSLGSSSSTAPLSRFLSSPPAALASLSRLPLPLPPRLSRHDWYCQPVVVVPSVGLWLAHPRRALLFGASTQDVRSVLGAPASVFTPPYAAPPLAITPLTPAGGAAAPVASAAAPSGPEATAAATAPPYTVTVGAIPYTWSFAHHGIDIVFDGTTHTATHFLLFTGHPGHRLFGARRKCNIYIASPRLYSAYLPARLHRSPAAVAASRAAARAAARSADKLGRLPGSAHGHGHGGSGYGQAVGPVGVGSLPRPGPVPIPPVAGTRAVAAAVAGVIAAAAAAAAAGGGSSSAGDQPPALAAAAAAAAADAAGASAGLGVGLGGGGGGDPAAAAGATCAGSVGGPWVAPVDACDLGGVNEEGVLLGMLPEEGDGGDEGASDGDGDGDGDDVEERGAGDVYGHGGTARHGQGDDALVDAAAARVRSLWSSLPSILPAFAHSHSTLPHLAATLASLPPSPPRRLARRLSAPALSAAAGGGAGGDAETGHAAGGGAGGPSLRLALPLLPIPAPVLDPLPQALSVMFAESHALYPLLRGTLPDWFAYPWPGLGVIAHVDDSGFIGTITLSAVAEVDTAASVVRTKLRDA